MGMQEGENTRDGSNEEEREAKRLVALCQIVEDW
jgi:hypothetical protein